MSNLTPRINRLESNLIIDGAMEIWPEGTSRSVANNTSAYGSVLFKLFNNNTGVTLTNSRQASVPSGTNLQFSNQVSKTAAGTLAANTYVVTDYYVEGYDVAPIVNSEFTVIFWVRSSVAATRTCTLRNTGATHTTLRSYTINTANTWELKAVRFNALSTCPGTINRTNGIGCMISFPVVAGSTFQNSTANSWLTGEFLTLSGQDSTWLTGTTHDFSIAGVMVLPGNWEGLTAAQYNFVRAGRNFEDELAMTQRYFEKSYDLNTNPASVTTIGAQFSVSINSVDFYDFGGKEFKSSKRVAPIVTIYAAGGVGQSGAVRDLSNSLDRSVTVSSQSENRYRINGSTLATNAAHAWHFTADARF
jgi:hypothetical protein